MKFLNFRKFLKTILIKLLRHLEIKVIRERLKIVKIQLKCKIYLKSVKFFKKTNLILILFNHNKTMKKINKKNKNIRLDPELKSINSIRKHIYIPKITKLKMRVVFLSLKMY